MYLPYASVEQQYMVASYHIISTSTIVISIPPIQYFEVHEKPLVFQSFN